MTAPHGERCSADWQSAVLRIGNPQASTGFLSAIQQINNCFVAKIIRPRRQPFPRPASGARGEGQGEGIFKERLFSPTLSSVGDGGEEDQPPVFSRIQVLFYKAINNLRYGQNRRPHPERHRFFNDHEI